MRFQSQSCIWHPTRRCWEPPTHPSLGTCTPAQPSPSLIKIVALDETLPPCSQRVPKHTSLISSLSAAPSPICSPISCRKRDTVRDLVVGRGSGWTSPDVHNTAGRPFSGNLRPESANTTRDTRGLFTCHVSRPSTTKGAMASLAAMKLLGPRNKLTKLARRAGRERRSVLISAAGITTPPPPTPPSFPCSLTIGVWEAPATGVRDKNL